MSIELAAGLFSIISFAAIIWIVWRNGASPGVLPLAWLLALGLHGASIVMSSSERITVANALVVVGTSILFSLAYLVRQPSDSRWPRTLLAGFGLVAAVLGEQVADLLAQAWSWLLGAEVRIPGGVIAGALIALAALAASWFVIRRLQHQTTS